MVSVRACVCLRLFRLCACCVFCVPLRSCMCVRAVCARQHLALHECARACTQIEALRKVCLDELEQLDKRNADGDIAEAVVALFAARGAKL